MSVEVREATSEDRARWDQLVAQSPQATPFHLTGAMEVLAEHSGTTLHPLVGRVGEEPVGLLPVYERAVGPLSTVFSPPPNLKISSQGPLLLNFEKLKARKATRRHAAFVDDCLAYIDRSWGPRYLVLRSPARYDDARPLVWNGLSTTPLYTYVVDLSQDRESLLSSFSSDARRNVTDDLDRELVIQEGGVGTIRRVVDQLQERHAEQGESYRVTPAFVEALWRELPEGVVRPYECRLDDEFVGGMVALEFGDTAYRWQGGAKTDQGVPVNDRLDWRLMRDAMDRGCTRYDLVGANNRRIAGYKAKFAPQLEPYFQAVRSQFPMQVLADLYKRLR